MTKKLLIISLSVAMILMACQPGETTSEEEKQEAVIEETEPMDTIRAEAVFLKVSNPDEVLEEMMEDMKNEEEIAAFIGVDKSKELLITHVSHKNQHHILFDHASEVLPLNLYYLNRDEIEPPFRVSIRHKVKDYKTWKWLYDSDEKNRMNAGMVLVQLGTLRDDPNDVFIVFAIPDVARAREMMGKPNVEKKLVQAGVIGGADVRFWRPVSDDEESPY